jgi:hypothetical protein
VIARDFFYPGKAVFIDHGNDLVTMYFHLAAIDVSEWQNVKKGHQARDHSSTPRDRTVSLFRRTLAWGSHLIPACCLGRGESPEISPNV